MATQPAPEATAPLSPPAASVAAADYTEPHLDAEEGMATTQGPPVTNRRPIYDSHSSHSRGMPLRSDSTRRAARFSPSREGASHTNGYGNDQDTSLPTVARSMRSVRPRDMDDNIERASIRESIQGRDDRQADGGRTVHASTRDSRPPRAYLSRPYYDETDPHGKGVSYLDDSRHRPADEEMGYYHLGHHIGAREHWRRMTAEEKAEVMRLPWTTWMNSRVKNHFVASLGELIGTFLFLFFAFAGTEVANIRSDVPVGNDMNSNTTTGATTGFNVAVLLYVSLIFGFSLMVNVWVFFRISGGLFNPAVTLGMLLVKAINVTRAVCLFVSQMLGSLLASVLVRYLFPENFNVRTTLSGGATAAQGVFIEALLTAELVFTIFMLAKEKHRGTFIAPVGIGLALFIAEMVGVQFTGGSLNPARSFGPCVITATFDQEHWIYWVGPLLGTFIAVAFYKFIKTLEYEMANPGADGDTSNEPVLNAEKKTDVMSKRTSSHFSTR